MGRVEVEVEVEGGRRDVVSVSIHFIPSVLSTPSIHT